MNETNEAGETPLADFIRLLSQQGRALTRGDLHLHPPTVADLAATETVLREVAKLAALEAPGNPPEFESSSALWAAEAFTWACGMLIDRAETEVEIPKRISGRQPRGATAAEHWSVDLVFRFFRDLIDRSAKIGREDPLHGQLLKLLKNWPLSSIGTEVENHPKQLGVVLASDCLRIVYVDRVIALQDRRRAANEQVASLVSQLTGQQPCLIGAFGDPLASNRETNE